MPEVKLKKQEIAVLKVLLEDGFYLFTTQVAHLSNVSWNTAMKKVGFRDFRKTTDKDGNRSLYVELCGIKEGRTK